jgi:hypothetical protein
VKSLADYLGTAPPAAGATESQAPAQPSLLDAKAYTAKEFSDAVLTSVEFRHYIINALTLGDLPAAIITRMMDYSWGKPAEKIEFEDKTARFEAMSRPELEQRMRMVQQMLSDLPDDDDTSVH